MNISSLYNNIITSANQTTNDALSNLYTPIEGNLDPTTQGNGDVSSGGESSFKDIITNEIEKLNTQQVKADELTQGFIRGDVQDLHTVLIATEEARVSLELAVQVRNKCVEAYKEINNMQL